MYIGRDFTLLDLGCLMLVIFYMLLSGLQQDSGVDEINASVLTCGGELFGNQAGLCGL